MKVTWATQSCMLTDPDGQRLSNVLDNLDYVDHQPIFFPPFSHTLPNPNTRHPIIAYGATSFVMAVAESGWKPGVWFNNLSFNMSHWDMKSDTWLNADAESMNIAALYQSSLPNDKEIFIRPTADTKAFTGHVTTVGEFRHFVEKLGDGYMVGNEQFNQSTIIAIASPKVIDTEYRFVIIDEVPVTASQYKPKHSTYVPLEAWHFVQTCLLKVMLPSSACILDVCHTPEGWRIIEVGCINAASFYECNREIIVRELSLLAHFY